MIRPRDQFRLAESLSRGSTESEWRCAIGRAYYAAFHQARELLQALGFQIPRAELVHAFLWKRLQSCGPSAVGLAGSRLHQLRTVRNRADYDVATNLVQKDAIAAVEVSRHTDRKKSLRVCPFGSSRGAVTAT